MKKTHFLLTLLVMLLTVAFSGSKRSDIKISSNSNETYNTKIDSTYGKISRQ